jgi:hypothetical protein
MGAVAVAYAIGVATEGQTSGRAGRCANHPIVASVGACDLCGRALCLGCAVPVRGRVIGPECLSKVLVDAPPLPHVPDPIPARGGRLALVGFGVVVITSVFPWSRLGDSSGYFGAWAPHWSLVAIGAAVLGLLLILVDRFRPADPRVGTASLFLLAIVAGAAAFLHHRHPPLLAVSTIWPWFAVAGAGVAILGAITNTIALLKARRPAA